jgi:hypothetical protein
MAKASSYHFHPKRIVRTGMVILGLGFLLGLIPALRLCFFCAPVYRVHGKKEKLASMTAFTFSLGLKEKAPVLPAPDLQGEITFSFDPPRPIGLVSEKRVLIRMKKGAGSKRVVLPCKVGLAFQDDRLVFSEGESSFWMELSLSENGQIETKSKICSLEGNIIETSSFLVAGQDCPFRVAHEFADGSPFRSLAEARWLGKDLFAEKKSVGERLEIAGTGFLELKEGDWLVWRDQKWEKCGAPVKDDPIARIQSVSPKSLVLEGWDAEGHVRLALNFAAGIPFKTRAEELFSSIRVRSEKQISCMLEKQCMVLKTGDWVLRMGNKWKILRKKEERDAFVNGNLSGDLFVLEQILSKQGQKMIFGKLYNPGRTQVVAMEIPVQSGRQARKRVKAQ